MHEVTNDQYMTTPQSVHAQYRNKTERPCIPLVQELGMALENLEASSVRTGAFKIFEAEGRRSEIKGRSQMT